MVLFSDVANLSEKEIGSFVRAASLLEFGVELTIKVVVEARKEHKQPHNENVGTTRLIRFPF